MSVQLMPPPDQADWLPAALPALEQLFLTQLQAHQRELMLAECSCVFSRLVLRLRYRIYIYTRIPNFSCAGCELLEISVL